MAIDFIQGHAGLRRVLSVCLGLLALQTVVALAPSFDAMQGLAHYPALHMALELAAILVALMVFMVGWVHASAQRKADLTIPACVFLAVALLDFAHMLSYPGMPTWITPSGPNKSIWFWFAARFTTALGLLVVALRPAAKADRAHDRHGLYLGAALAWVALVCGLLLGVVDTSQAVFFVPQQGLTPLKHYVEYLLVAVHLVTAAVLVGVRGNPAGGMVRRMLLGAVLTMAMSEMFFTFYAEVTDVFNLLGHVYKVVAFVFVYRAFVAAGIEEPVRLLEEMQQYQAALIDASPDLMFVVDRDGRFIDYHSPRSDLLALPPSHFIGKRIEAVLPPVVASVGMQAIAEADVQGYSSGKTYALELPHGLHWFELSVSRFQKRAQEPVLYLFMARDITRRVLDAQQMRIFATAFESQQGMMITNARQEILRVNKAFTKITEYTQDEVLGKSPGLLSSGRHTPDFYRAMWQAIRETGAWRGEVWNRKKSGQVFPEWLSIAAVRDEQGEATHYVASFSDASLHKAAENQIRNLAFADALTGLPNRLHLVVLLQQLVHTCSTTGQRGALMLVDLDNFRTLNDALGRSHGDALLQQVAMRLTATVHEPDQVARVGGDSFAILIGELPADAAAAQAMAQASAQAVLQQLDQAYDLGATRHHMTSSVGITMLDGAQSDYLDEHYKRAELAMYEAKKVGGNQVHFFTDVMQEAIENRAFLESALRHALPNQELELLYQPQVDAQGRVQGVEALLRWRHPERGMISPAVFIPLAEETGIILAIGQWVLETACNTLVRWAGIPGLAQLKMAVNVSAHQFAKDEFVDDCLALIRATGCPADGLKIELTESSLAANVHTIAQKMEALRERGISFSLDDFGTGYSSLAYLKRLPLNQLKIDQGFVRDILDDQNDAAIAGMVIALAASMGLEVIAEGVETPEQRDYLARIGCHNYQGYLYGRPMPRDALEHWIAERDAVGAA